MREAALRRGLVGPECLWTSLEVIPSTRSTNSDLLDRLPETRIDAPELVLPALPGKPAKERYGTLKPIPGFKP